MRTIILLALIAMELGGCQSVANRDSGSYQITSVNKINHEIWLTVATDWKFIDCNATIDGLRVGGQEFYSEAGVAHMDIFVPPSYDKRKDSDFGFSCSKHK